VESYVLTDNYSLSSNKVAMSASDLLLHNKVSSVWFEIYKEIRHSVNVLSNQSG